MHRSTLLAPALLVLVSCGGGAAWKPVAVPAIPVPPGPPPPAAPVAATPAPPKPTAHPIDGKLAEAAATEAPLLSRKSSCAKGTCKLAHLVPDDVKPAKEDKSPGLVWEEVIGKGATLVVPRDTDVDLLGVVVRGEVTVAGDGEKGAPKPLGVWHAFRAPGAGLSLKAPSAEARVVLVAATSGEPIAAAVEKLGAKGGNVGWKTRPSPLATVDLAAKEDLAWGGGAYHARLGFEGDGSPRASLGVLFLSKDAPVAEHAHDAQWEHLAMLDGAGQLVLEEAGKASPLEVKDGTVASVPPGTKHAWKPAGTDLFLGIQVYTPPGPEQRFKTLAGK